MIMAENKIVTQSKITLSRNVKGYPFPLSSRDNDATNIISSVYEAVSRNGNFDLYRISQISEQKKRSLSARGLITDLLLSSPMGGAIISADKSVSVMVNEEDHVVEQCFVKGFNLDLAYEKLDAIDHLICAKNDICFHEKLGYLTSAPANIGTGMHATVTVFLPALSLTKNIQRCVSAVSSLGITMRATEGDETGYYYELSNQKTLGLTEKEIIDLVKTATSHVEGAEQEARSLLKISSEVEIRTWFSSITAPVRSLATVVPISSTPRESVPD